MLEVTGALTFALGLFPVLPGLTNLGALLCYQVLMALSVWLILGLALRQFSLAVPSTVACVLAFLALVLLSTGLAHRLTPFVAFQVALVALFFLYVPRFLSGYAELPFKTFGLPVAACLMVEVVWAWVQAVRAFSVGESALAAVGTLDDTTGVAAAALLLWVMGLSAPTSRWRVLRWGVMGCALLLIVWVGSRSALIGAAVALVACCFKFERPRFAPFFRHRRWVFGLLAVLVMAGGVALYGAKRDSADGRLLIWRCTGRLIAEQPVLGRGKGGFEADYMDCQARYFALHGTGGRAALLADDVFQPMSDPLRWLTEYGFVGILPLVVCLVLILRIRLRRHSSTDRAAWLLLLSLGAMSLTSYPLTYPFVQVAVLSSVAWLMSRQLSAVRAKLGKHPWCAALGAVGGVVLAVGACFYTLHLYGAERQWAVAHERRAVAPLGQTLPRYEKLAVPLRSTPAFLYDYAMACSEASLWPRSDSLLRAYHHWGWNAETTLLAADNAQIQGRTQQADSLFRLAHFMVPVRFYPLYRLMLSAEQQGRLSDAHRLARIILHKRVKVPSPEVELMKKEARRVLAGA